jgi:tetratricopeptide (TPR) repeat protein
MLEEMGRYTDALASFGQALQLKPAEAEALVCYQRVLEHMPDAAQGFNSLGIALSECGQSQQAMASFQRATELAPGDAEAYNNAGLLLASLGRTEEAIEYYRKAVDLSPDYANGQWNLALALLSVGQFPEGWQRFGWRRRANLGAIPQTHRDDPPTWRGQPLDSGTLLIRHEQGVGDCLQMIRYLPMVRSRLTQAGHTSSAVVCLEVPESLMGLLSTVDGADQVVTAPADGRPALPADLHAFTLDLPGILQTSLDTIPAATPYVGADPAKVSRWKARLDGPGLKVGLVWAGSPRHTRDSQRSCPLRFFRNMVDVPGVRFFSLQHGVGRGQLAVYGTWPIVDLADDLTDWSETAATIANLDLLISVDTAVLHLAGAMAKPAWAVLPFVADWRWMKHRSDSPWYPSLRLFRQPAPGDWEQAIASIKDELRSLAAATPCSSTSLDRALRLINEGHALLGQGEVGPAMTSFDQAIALHPELAEAHYNRGVALTGLGRCEEAVASYQQAIQARPGFVQARINLANLYRHRGQFDLAVSHFQQVLQVNPEHWKALDGLGETLRLSGQTEQAIAHLQRAVHARPEIYEAHLHLGRAWADHHGLDEAVECFSRAARLRPHQAEPHCNLGAALALAGCHDQALAEYDLAIEIDPDSPGAHWNRALLYLQTGRFREGWKEAAWRHRMATFAGPGSPFRPSRPLWDGSRFDGRRLLVRCEQGLGDTLQFSRYLPAVKRLGGDVLFEVQQPLFRLFEGIPAIDGLIGQRGADPAGVAFDLEVWLMDLPAILDTTIDTIPAKVPYLWSNPMQAQAWRERLAGPGLKVGLAWAGSARHAANHIRSCPLVDLEPLTRAQGVRFFSLQKDVTDSDKAWLRRMDIRPLGDDLKDLGDTAAAMEALDLVISVDTAVLHLAGALGKTAWGLLGYAPDWRWMLHRDDSPWYPSLRLFRQARGQSWQAVVSRAARELTALNRRPRSPG